MEYQFEMLRQTRKNLLGILKSYNTDQLNRIPAGFKNNMAWNLGHVLVSQQNLCYKLSGLPIKIPADYVVQFGKGTVPTKKWTQEEIDSVKMLLNNTVNILMDDYDKGIFVEYHGYQSQYGVRLGSIEDAIVFNNVHEGFHLGYVMAMRKAIDQSMRNH